ncbi:hypothetical protein IHE33_09745 [Mycetohabitans endofungorum]
MQYYTREQCSRQWRGFFRAPTLSASLAAALASAGKHDVAIGLGPQNAPRLHFGVPFDAIDGLSRATLEGRPWSVRLQPASRLAAAQGGEPAGGSTIACGCRAIWSTHTTRSRQLSRYGLTIQTCRRRWRACTYPQATTTKRPSCTRPHTGASPTMSSSCPPPPARPCRLSSTAMRTT